jgi:hypothetical protein
VVLPETLHDADGSDGVLDLSELALELLDVLLDVVEDGGAAHVVGHPRVIDDVLRLYPLVVVNRQQFLH